ncbi:mevalonate kinase [Liquorilactobacillus sicerae]|uniref:mevalonate kinase n=1 Tax=Liquorilactobacillus sicerae TaxID=1416943 RepID=UPI0024811733|nr:mevalonate kinase [Liquorilactobacillus sicerae]
MISTNQKNGFGKSHAKIILIGEHSVVYGQPAIALPLSAVKTQVTITANRTDKQTIDCRYFSGLITNLPTNMTGLQHLITYILAKIIQPVSGFKITIRSQLPEERGMGSSAATAVATIRALFDFFKLPLSHQQLLRLANIEEVDTHGNPSGLDAATSASSTPIWMIKNKELLPIPIHLDACLLICDSGVKGKTSEAVAEVKERLELQPIPTTQALNNLGKLAILARKQLTQNDSAALGKTFNQAQADLKSLGVSSPRLDSLIAQSLKLGSLGSKLTGGGRGGCFICLMPNRTSAEQAAIELKKAGVTATWIQPLSVEEELE